MCKRSEFFNRALNGNWSEKKDRLVKLPEDDTKIFSLYVNLIYTGEIPGQTGYSKMMPDEFQKHIMAIVKLYILAEKLQDKQAKNVALTTVHAKIALNLSPDRLPNAEIVELMYRNTPKGSLGRRLMVHLWNDNNTKDILGKSEGICKEFFVDLARSLHINRPNIRNVACSVQSNVYEEKL